ncbi:hypothetical protein FCE95_14125 [Luteimonas gilva]|uniref:Uncharacterized protein n=1 Tax=Luteimonas gilva TaxID=2572684 RepID=A0A4U5JKV5_9GAMM|nr:hypothetical protein [Luteimonas gilva]TKR29296.1 hypothetical protein FCE95_14125 [Luteimonas gilva]
MDIDASQIRRGRIFLAVFGLFFAAVALFLWWMPSPQTREIAPPVCALIGIALLLTARLASDRTIARVQNLLTGWP